jgi:enterobactin synthetase component D
MTAPIAVVASRFGRCGLLAIDDSDERMRGAGGGDATGSAGGAGVLPRGIGRAPPGDPAAAPRIALDAARATLHPDEQQLADGLAPVRRRDWIAGRAALRALLAAEAPAAAPGAVTADDRGAPIPPAGWVASISHKRGVAAAVLARDDGWTVGVDVEVAGVPRVDVASRILTDPELVQLAAFSGAERGRRTTLAFAIKEAVYKAIDPMVRRYVGFREVELAIAADGAVAVRPVDADAIPLVIEAEWRELGGLWLCVARARRP